MTQLAPAPPHAVPPLTRAARTLPPPARLLAIGLPAAIVLAFGLRAHAAHQRSLADMTAAELRTLVSRLTDAETAQRGYALIGDAAYLQPYQEVRTNVARAERTHRALRARHAAAEAGDARRTTALLLGGTLLSFSLALVVNLVLVRHGWHQTRAARQLEEQNVLLEEQAMELELQGEALQQKAAELARANEALQGREERFRALIEHASDVITVTALDGRILYESPSLERVLGYTPEEMLGRSVLEFIHPDDVAVVSSTISRLAEDPGSLCSVEFRFRHRDGSWITFESVGRNLLAHPAVRGIVANSRDITERKKAQERERDLSLEQAARAAAEQGEARIRDLVESVADAFLGLDREWRITVINAPAERMLAAPRDRLVGTSIWEVAPQVVGGPVHEAALRAMAERAPAEVEAPSFHAPPRWLHYHLYPTREGIAVYARDVTASRQLYAALAQSERSVRLLHAITSARDLPFEETVRRLLVMGSERFGLPVGLFSRVRGSSLAVEVATPSGTLAPGEVFPLDEMYCSATMLSEEPVAFTHAGASDWRSHRCYAGHAVEAYLGTTVVVAGRPYGTLCFTGPEPRPAEFTEADRDILQLMAQWIGGEIERRQGEHLLRTAKEDAEAANLAKSEFLSRMSHELRTPLNAILGFGQLLELDTSDPDTAEGVDQILRAGRHLLALIDEVLDLARIEAGRMSLSLEPVAAREVLRQSLDLVRHLAAEQEVTFHAGGALDAPDRVTADVQRLKQVFVNLLSNAIKYNRRGGSVTLSCDPAAEGWLRIAVRDTGFGIPAARLDELFTPFERLGAEEGTVQGTGLGLAITRGLVETMGGRMGVESVEGEGSTFWVELPTLTGSDEPHAPAADPPRTDAHAGPRTVLVVEDNRWNVRLLERLFSRRPELRLVVAVDGADGVRVARAEHPELILLDLNLPDMSGEEVLRQLRQDPGLCEVPVIVLSGDAMPASMERLRSLGVRDYITKPYELTELLGMLDAHLTR